MCKEKGTDLARIAIKHFVKYAPHTARHCMIWHRWACAMTGYRLVCLLQARCGVTDTHLWRCCSTKGVDIHLFGMATPDEVSPSDQFWY